jgi:hypothetical protein
MVFGGMSRLFFVVDELLLFAVLVLAKHRLNPWIGRVLARRVECQGLKLYSSASGQKVLDLGYKRRGSNGLLDQAVRSQTL